MDSLLRWHGKVALVTGATSGIGRALAIHLGKLPMKIALAGRRKEELKRVADEIKTGGGEALVLTGDQTELAVNAGFFRDIRARWGGVDLLVNCAGLRGGNSLLEAPLAEIQAALNLNVLAAIVCMREAVTDMRGKADAGIINISSMTGHRVLPGVPALYAATKHALRVLTDGLRSELAAEKSAIKVSLISPGLVDTPWHSLPDGIVTRHGGYPHDPLITDDIVDAVRYILSTPARVQVGDILLRPSAQPF